MCVNSSDSYLQCVWFLRCRWLSYTFSGIPFPQVLTKLTNLVELYVAQVYPNPLSFCWSNYVDENYYELVQHKFPQIWMCNAGGWIIALWLEWYLQRFRPWVNCSTCKPVKPHAPDIPAIASKHLIVRAKWKYWNESRHVSSLQSIFCHL